MSQNKLLLVYQQLHKPHHNSHDYVCYGVPHRCSDLDLDRGHGHGLDHVDHRVTYHDHVVVLCHDLADICGTIPLVSYV